MSKKSTYKTTIQQIGIGLFVIAITLFTLSLGIDNYQLSEKAIAENINNEYHREALLAEAEAINFYQNTYGTSFAFTNGLKKLFDGAAARLEERIEAGNIPEGKSEWDLRLQDWVYKSSAFSIVKASAFGPVSNNPLLFFFLTIGLAILSGLFYILPKFSEIPGIKHNHIYHSALTRGLEISWRSIFLGAALIGILLYGVFYMNQNLFWPAVTLIVTLLIGFLVLQGKNTEIKLPARSAGPYSASAWLGIITGVYLIGFYILLYWVPQHITAWVHMVDPISQNISGNPASQWFLYGLLYTIIVLVMGMRMITKYQHNKYQIIRTFSVMFFQLAFAFLIPEILVRLNQPWYDFKNIWPLDYDFFFAWNLNELINSGAFGLFIMVWGIALIVIAVPVITYFYGKRWYCSWVCGCGGLAETFGDPYRQLSDKSLRAWKFERFIVHGVLVFAVIMTGLTLYTYFSGDSKVFGIQTNNIQQWYGFVIGAGFAGVVGTGFYPIMGNRVWCRFGCPLAAYLGLVQRFKSRFRITTNGGQCISCGNCSTYCEMGIDVRWYAQRGQDIVRASCVGCGVCSAVCPRGVLRLENSAMDVNDRAQALRTIHISENEVKLIQ